MTIDSPRCSDRELNQYVYGRLQVISPPVDYIWDNHGNLDIRTMLLAALLPEDQFSDDSAFCSLYRTKQELCIAMNRGDHVGAMLIQIFFSRLDEKGLNLRGYYDCEEEKGEGWLRVYVDLGNVNAFFKEGFNWGQEVPLSQRGDRGTIEDLLLRIDLQYIERKPIQSVQRIQQVDRGWIQWALSSVVNILSR